MTVNGDCGGSPPQHDMHRSVHDPCMYTTCLIGILSISRGSEISKREEGRQKSGNVGIGGDKERDMGWDGGMV